MTKHNPKYHTILSAHLEQLHKIKSLNTGLEWVTMCPDQDAKQALIGLIGEEIAALLAGVIYAAEDGPRV